MITAADVGEVLDRTRTAMGGRFELPDGTAARPVFELMAERYLEPEYSSESVEEKTGIPAENIRRIAAELAHAAFEQEIELDVEDDLASSNILAAFLDQAALDAGDAQGVAPLGQVADQ